MKREAGYIIAIMGAFLISIMHAHTKEIFIPKSELDKLVTEDQQLVGAPYSEKEVAESSKILASELLDNYLMRQYLLDNKLMKASDEKRDCELFTLEALNFGKKRSMAAYRARTRVSQVSEKELESYYKRHYGKIQRRYNHGAMRLRKPPLPDNPPAINDDLRELTRQELYSEWLSEEIEQQFVQKLDNTPLDILKQDVSYPEMMNNCLRKASYVKELFQKPFEERAAQEFDKMSIKSRKEAYKKYAERLNYLPDIDSAGVDSDIIRSRFVEVRSNELVGDRIKELKSLYEN